MWRVGRPKPSGWLPTAAPHLSGCRRVLGKIHSEGFTLRGAVATEERRPPVSCWAWLFMAPPPGGRPPRPMAAPLPAQMKPKNYVDLALHICTLFLFNLFLWESQEHGSEGVGPRHTSKAEGGSKGTSAEAQGSRDSGRLRGGRGRGAVTTAAAAGHPSGKSASPPGHRKDRTQTPWPLRALLQLRAVTGPHRWSCTLHARLESQGRDVGWAWSSEASEGGAG